MTPDALKFLPCSTQSISVFNDGSASTLSKIKTSEFTFKALMVLSIKPNFTRPGSVTKSILDPNFLHTSSADFTDKSSPNRIPGVVLKLNDCMRAI